MILSTTNPEQIHIQSLTPNITMTAHDMINPPLYKRTTRAYGKLNTKGTTSKQAVWDEALLRAYLNLTTKGATDGGCTWCTTNTAC